MINRHVIAMIFYVSVWIIGSITIFYHYRKEKYKALFYFGTALVFLGIWSSLMGLSYYFAEDIFFRIATVFFGIGVYFGILFFEYIRRDRPNLYIVGMGFSNIAVLTVLMFIEDSVQMIWIDGIYQIPTWGGLNLFYSFFTLYQGLMLGFLVFYQIWKNSPPLYRKKANRVVIGVLVFSGGTLIASIASLGDVFWMAIASAIGVLILESVMVKNIELMYVLPFGLDELTVIEKHSGLSLYSFSWVEAITSEVLFAGLLKALDSLSIEVLRKGSIREISLEEGTLIMTITDHLIVGLSTKKSSNYVRECVARFALAFQEKFLKYLDTDDINLDKFTDAEELIKKYFGNIPVRR